MRRVGTYSQQIDDGVTDLDENAVSVSVRDDGARVVPVLGAQPQH